MDINCTHACYYQQDGKCTLQELPIKGYEFTNTTAQGIDCLYYENR